MNSDKSIASSLSRWRSAISRARKPLVALAAIGTMLGGAAGYITFYRTVAGSVEPSRGHQSPAARNHGPLSVLVLPLENHTGDPAKTYMADALTTAITSDLNRLQDAIIVPPVVAVGLLKRQLTLQQLGSEARVNFVLQGGVSTTSDRIRLTATLSETASGRQLWSKVFESPLGDLFTLQDEMTRRVRISVGPEMLLAAAREAETRKDNPQVADLLLRIRAMELQQQSLPKLKLREELARQALAIDPQSHRARASLAVSLWLTGHNFASELGLDATGLRSRAAQAAVEARKVLAGDPDNINMRFVLAHDARLRRDFDTARELYEQALVLDPKMIFVYNNFGDMYLELGQPEKARAILLRGIEQPTYLPSPIAYSNLAYSAILLGTYDEAIDWGRKSVSAAPTIPWGRVYMALAFAMKGDERSAKQAVSELISQSPKFKLQPPQEEVRIWPGREVEWRAFVEERWTPAVRLAGLPQGK